MRLGSPVVLSYLDAGFEQGLHLEGVNDDEALGGAPGGTARWGNFWDDWTVDEVPALMGVTVGAAIL